MDIYDCCSTGAGSCTWPCGTWLVLTGLLRKRIDVPLGGITSLQCCLAAPFRFMFSQDLLRVYLIPVCPWWRYQSTGPRTGLRDTTHYWFSFECWTIHCNSLSEGIQLIPYSSNSTSNSTSISFQFRDKNTSWWAMLCFSSGDWSHASTLACIPMQSLSTAYVPSLNTEGNHSCLRCWILYTCSMSVPVGYDLELWFKQSFSQDTWRKISPRSTQFICFMDF